MLLNLLVCLIRININNSINNTALAQHPLIVRNERLHRVGGQAVDHKKQLLLTIHHSSDLLQELLDAILLLYHVGFLVFVWSQRRHKYIVAPRNKRLGQLNSFGNFGRGGAFGLDAEDEADGAVDGAFEAVLLVYLNNVVLHLGVAEAGLLLELVGVVDGRRGFGEGDRVSGGLIDFVVG